MQPRTAILIPCLNEAKTIRSVIEGFRQHIPQAKIIVCDNGSTDGTETLAAQAGAKVLHEANKGKGNAVRRMLKEVEADCYVLVDGDGTHDPASAAQMIEAVTKGKADVVYGQRVHDRQKSSLLRIIGNHFFVMLTNICLGAKFKDALTGYRAFSRPYAKYFPCQSTGFEIESEMNVYTVEGRFRMLEIPVPYADREDNNDSKLRIVRDSIRILWAILYFTVAYNNFYKSLKRT